MRINYFEFDNETAKAMVVEAIERSLYLLPPWIYEILVYAGNEQGDAVCRIRTDAEYRRLTIWVYPVFYEYPAARQLQTIRHEFAHAYTGELLNWVLDTFVEQIKDNDTLQSVARDALIQKIEGATQDICRLVDELESREE